MPQISGVVIAFNEERNIARCIESLSKVVDEIIVVDSFSKDLTKEICLSKDVRFIENPFRNHGDQKKFAALQASHDIILSLDADEYLSEELTKSILEVKLNWKNQAYKMNRLNMFGDKWIHHGSWYPDQQLRLWDRRVGMWQGDIHETVVLEEGIKANHLHGDILHRSFRNCSEVIAKIQSYTEIYAKQKAKKKNVSVFKILVHSSTAFFKSYIIKRGFLDGFEGLMVASMLANHTLYKYAKLYEVNKGINSTQTEIQSETKE